MMLLLKSFLDIVKSIDGIKAHKPNVIFSFLSGLMLLLESHIATAQPEINREFSLREFSLREFSPIVQGETSSQRSENIEDVQTEPTAPKPPSGDLEACRLPEEALNLKLLVASSFREDPTSPFPREVMTRSNTFTLLNTPTLWFYVPYLAPLQAELSLLDENNLEIDTIQFELPSQPGIIGVKLPSIPEVNRRYRWVFSLICNPDVPALNITIGGVIQQVRFTSEDVAPDWIEFSETHRSYDAIRTQIFNLEEMGIWYDILTAVGTRYFRTPADATIAEDWNVLLESANLDAYRDIPIVAIYSEN